MQTPSLSDIKKVLLNMDQTELITVCLRLAKYKKENKELLSYLLFHSSDEDEYIHLVKELCDKMFDEVNYKGAYILTKQVRKTLRYATKYIRYSGQQKTEIEILIHCAMRIKPFTAGKQPVSAIVGIYERQIQKIEKAISGLHEDFQSDYRSELQSLFTPAD